MEEIYKKIWSLAKPYYEKGRVYDVPHIEWMMAQVDRLSKIEKFDEGLLMPLCILHDVGYSTLSERNPNIKDKNSKIAHMEAGAKIAKEILEKVDYPPRRIEEIVKCISVHDNWALGDDTPYKNSKEMALFNDLDFLSAVSNVYILKNNAKSLGKRPEEMINFWINDEKHLRRPFCCKETADMFGRYIEQMKKELGRMKT